MSGFGISSAFEVDELRETCLSYCRDVEGTTQVTKLDLRPLLWTDLDDVQAINALTYGGHDYIAEEFSYWLERNDIDVWTLAAESDGELAGFEVLKLYDFGQTGWLEALRVHPRWRNRKIATGLQQKLIAMAIELQLPCVRYTTATANVASRKLACSCGLFPVASWAYTLPRQKIPLNSFAERAQAVQTRLRKRWAMPEISPRTSKDAKEVMKILQTLKVKYLLQSWWKAFDCSLPNLEKLIADGSHEEPLAIIGMSNVPDSLSWGLYKRDALGVTLWATIYAQDIFSTLVHMIAQLDAGIQRGATSAMIMYATELEPEMHRFGLAERCRTALDEEGSQLVAKCVLLFERRLAG